METILVNDNRKITHAGIPADQLVETFVVISAPSLSDIALKSNQTNYWQIDAYRLYSLYVVYRVFRIFGKANQQFQFSDPREPQQILRKLLKPVGSYLKFV